MLISPFLIERYFAKHEFSAKYLLSSSDVESLSQNELLGMADTAGRGLWDNLKLNYTESQGHPLLRREIANLYKTVWPDDVIVLTPEEGVFIAMNVLLQKGDHAIILSPSYQSLSEVANSIGAEVTPWMLETNGVRWSLNPDFLERSVRNTTKLIVINFPHNPTGYQPDKKEFERIVEFARRRKVFLFSDEMYRFSEYNEEQRLPSVCDLYEQGITLSGLSKSFALPGLRIGWLATKDRGLIRRFNEFKDYTTICSSAPSEILAIIALRAREQILDRTHALISKNLMTADAFFAKHHTLFEWIRPMASPVAFPRYSSTEPIGKLCEELVNSSSVMLLPGPIFGYPGNHFRVGLGRKNFGEGLAVVEGFLKERGGKK